MRVRDNEGGAEVPQPPKQRSVLDDFLIGASFLGEKAGEAFNFAMGAQQTPMSAGIVGLDTAARTGKFTAEQQADYTRRSQEVAPKLAGRPITTLGTVPLMAADVAWEYGAARPASTGMLAVNPDSPLYKDGYVDQTDENGQTQRVKTEAGLQLGDIQQAWNRSGTVSFGMATAANPIASKVSGVGALGAMLGIDKYDPWSNVSIAQAHENPVYNAFTGGYDLGLQIVIPPAVKAGRLLAVDKLGLRTTVQSAEDLAMMRNQWVQHKAAEAGEPLASPTSFGMHVDSATAETNWQRLMESPFVRNSVGIDKPSFARILAKTNDRDTVANLFLASRGDIEAVRTLMDSAPHTVWTIADMNSAVKDAWSAGALYRPEGDALIKVNQIFDSQIAADEYFSSAKDLFTISGRGAADGRNIVVGSTWMPTQSRLIEGARLSSSNARYAMKSGDYSGAPRWIAERYDSGKGTPVTVVLQWTGSRQPLGMVSMSGARPGDWYAEAEATFNTVPEFRGNRTIVVGQEAKDGTVVPVTMNAREWRDSWLTRHEEAATRGNIQQSWQAMEDEAVNVMADSIGVDRSIAARFVQGYRGAASDNASYMRKTGGYLFNEDGERILIDPATMPQLLDSFPTLPLAEVRELLIDEFGSRSVLGRTKNALTGTQEALISAFEAGQKVFRTNVLFRAGYTGKNSIMEPWLASYLAHGTILSDEGLAASLGNFAKNRRNNAARAVYALNLDRLVRRAFKGRRGNAVRAELQETIRQRNDYQRMMDDLVAEHDTIMAGRGRGAADEVRKPEIIAQLQDLRLRMEGVEATLDNRIPEWRQIVEPASLLDVRTWLLEHETLIANGGIGSVAEDVANIRSLYDELAERVQTPGYSGMKQIEQLQAQIEKIDARIGSLQVEQGTVARSISDITGMRGYYGSGSGMTTILGDTRVPAAFNEQGGLFGSGYRAEASAQTTNELTYDPSLRASHEIGKWQRTGVEDVINPTDPGYWDQLAKVVNRYFRGDPLASQILSGTSRVKLVEWLNSEAGRSWQRRMGYNPRNAEYLKPRDIYSQSPLDELITVVNRYVPDENLRTKAAHMDVTGPELQATLGARDDLSRIMGEDFKYVPNSPVARALAKIDNVFSNFWRFIATLPEDRLARWPFYNREFRAQLEQRAAILKSQGVKIDTDTAMSLRQAAHRAALDETEKVFYNIRRYSTPVYLSRFLLGFPGAFFNSFYRYGRLAVKEPERMFQTALFASDILRYAGVDRDGNHVKDLRDAEYIMIPYFPWEKHNDTDKNRMMPILSAVSLTINYPSLTWLPNLAMSVISDMNPSTEDIMRRTMGDGAFDSAFPYGFSKNPLSTVTGPYQRDLWRGMRGVKDVDFLQYAVEIYADNVARHERDYADVENPPPMPTFNEAIQQTQDFLYARAQGSWRNPIAITEFVPGQLMRDKWYEIRSMYPDDTAAARAAYVHQFGDWSRWYTYSSSDYTTFVPSTQAAYDRIWVDYPDLAASLRGVRENPDMITLLTIGADDGTFSQSISNFLRENPLPGDDVPVATRLNGDEFQSMVLRNDGWNAFSEDKAKYDAERSRLVALREKANGQALIYARSRIKNLDASWKNHVNNELSAWNEPWWIDYNDGSSNKAELAAIMLNKIVTNPKFAAKDGKTPIWQNIKGFLEDRQRAKTFIENEPDSDKKKLIREQAAEFFQKWYVQPDSRFAAVYDRYFAKEWSD